MVQATDGPPQFLADQLSVVSMAAEIRCDAFDKRDVLLRGSVSRRIPVCFPSERTAITGPVSEAILCPVTQRGMIVAEGESHCATTAASCHVASSSECRSLQDLRSIRGDLSTRVARQHRLHGEIVADLWRISIIIALLYTPLCP